MSKSKANVTALSIGPKHHFFSYYGINPWDPIHHHLALETDFHERCPDVGDIAQVGPIHYEPPSFI